MPMGGCPIDEGKNGAPYSVLLQRCINGILILYIKKPLQAPSPVIFPCSQGNLLVMIRGVGGSQERGFLILGTRTK
jgi:hypothetical protein